MITNNTGIPHCEIVPTVLNSLPTNAITSVLQLLRSPQSYAVLEALHLDYTYITSAGSRGYCAFKEMLQNGILGHAMMVESHDLMTVGKSTVTTNSNINDEDFYPALHETHVC